MQYSGDKIPVYEVGAGEWVDVRYSKVQWFGSVDRPGSVVTDLTNYKLVFFVFTKRRKYSLFYNLLFIATFWTIYKLDGVGPVDNRPSTDNLYHFVKK